MNCSSFGNSHYLHIMDESGVFVFVCFDHANALVSMWSWYDQCPTLNCLTCTFLTEILQFSISSILIIILIYINSFASHRIRPKQSACLFWSIVCDSSTSQRICWKDFIKSAAANVKLTFSWRSPQNYRLPDGWMKYLQPVYDHEGDRSQTDAWVPAHI